MASSHPQFVCSLLVRILLFTLLQHGFQDPSLVKFQGYINGQWVNAKSGETISVTSLSPSVRLAAP